MAFIFLPNRVRYWLTEAEPDCFFVVGPENGPTQRIGALKLLLMGDSQPFRAMLQDSQLSEKGDIRIIDIEPQTFLNYLKCAYGAEESVIRSLAFEELLKLLYMSDKYLSHEIKNKTIMKLRKLFSYENIFLGFSYPITYEHEYFTNEILEVLKFDFTKFMDDERFLDLSETAVAWLLKQQCYTVKEIDIWNSTLRWAKHKTNSTDSNILRSYLLDLLQYFRFLTMEFTEFWENVVSTEILLKDEVLEICEAFALGPSCSDSSDYFLNKNCNNRFDIHSVSDNMASSFLENPGISIISCSVKEISSFQTGSTHFSNTYRWLEHLWIVRISKVKTNNAKQSYKKKYALSVYVGCQGQTSTWDCFVKVEISLINRKGKQDVIKSYDRKFTDSSRDWGYEKFEEWDTVLNPDNGFVQNDTVIVMVKIQSKQ